MKHVSVRGTSIPNYKKKTNKSCISIEITSLETTFPVRRSPSKLVPKRETIHPTHAALSPPPPPPQTRRSIQDLASQLEYRIAHHTGYVPKRAVPIAFFSKKTNTKTKMTIHPKIYRPWNIDKRCLSFSTTDICNSMSGRHELKCQSCVEGSERRVFGVCSALRWHSRMYLLDAGRYRNRLIYIH